jgi:hypothetical protein
MTEAEQHQWLVASRHKIHGALATLHTLSTNEYRPILLRSDVNRDVFSLLVGASFSLWRAAFLSKAGRTPSDVLDRAHQLLTKLVEDNSATYSEEKNTQHWMVGFHLNNARFRLKEIYAKLGEPTGPLASFVLGPDTIPDRGPPPDPTTLWNEAYIPLLWSLNHLRELMRLSADPHVTQGA